MNIGEAAQRSGVTAKTIRYYESIGLIGPAVRRRSGYRDYGDEDVKALRFVRRARALGFSVEQCRGLLSLQRDGGRASSDVKALAQEHVRDVADKIRRLEEMRAALDRLVADCHGDARPYCPILETLADPGDTPAPDPDVAEAPDPDVAEAPDPDVAEAPRETVVRFMRAYYGGDAEAVRRCIADDVVFTGPGVAYRGADAFLKASAHVAPGSLGYDTHKVFADGPDVCVFHDLRVRHRVGLIPIAEWFRVESGRIVSIRILFDTAPFAAPGRAGPPGETAADPVCGMRVEKSSAAATRTHAGVMYYFCNPGCAEAFARDPGAYDKPG